MDKCRIFETDEYLKNLGSLDARNKRFVETKLKEYVYPQLRSQPHFGPNIKKLRDYKPETWRYKIGMFRVFYAIDSDQKIIHVLTLDFRKDSYRR